MDYRGVRYTIRAGIEPNLWSISIYPDGIESRASRIYGLRKDAEFEAHSKINAWLQRNRRQSKLMAARDVERK